MAKTILFVHGMFLNSNSWDAWQSYFQRKGYDTIAPEWPFHEGAPAALRAAPPAGLGKLSLEDVISATREAAAGRTDLILIGHSVGGLIVQKLISEGIGNLGVPISSVAPNRMLSLDWGFLRNSVTITNPLKGDEPFPMDADGFYQNFGNAMGRPESDAAFERYAVHESRNVLRDCMGDTGKIDLDRRHVPLLFIAGDKDEIIPAGLCEKNSKAYTDKASRVEYREFKNRGHYICGQADWEQLASYIDTWVQGQGASAVSAARRAVG
jgi:pimeloyl-ACP methyl ester carboxylesterase